jgi:predicted acylesterase/phospholipase RssA/CRP-like cAMP-binding protein
MLRSVSPPDRDKRLQVIRSVSIFRDLNDDEVAALDEVMAWRAIEADAPLFHAGDPGDALYVVVEGRLDAWARGRRRNDPEQEVRLGWVFPGQVVGEMALLGDRPRTATVRAVRDSILLELPRAAFERVVARNAHAALTLARVLVERATARTESEAGPRAFALVPATPSAPARAVAESLLRAFGQRPPAFVDAARLDSQIGVGAANADVGDPAHAGGERWLGALEADAGRLLLLADGGDSPWTRRCVRYADLVLIVADARERPSAEHLTQRLRRLPEGGFDRREIVLVHPDGATQATGSAGWIAAVPADDWHHVRLAVRADFDRLARFLEGRAVGLALAGGGARGYAHVGVLRAMREAGVPVDLACGTSMGSIVAGLRALGQEDGDIAEAIRRNFVSRSPLDYTLPVVSIARGRRFDEIIEELFGDRLIEDTWSRFFCVSSSLRRAAPVVHRRGPMRSAIRASCALPGVMPPFGQGGDLLVDGVFLDNLPAEEARRHGAGRTVAVNLLPPTESSEWAPLSDDAGPLRAAARLLDPRASSRTPPILRLGIDGVFLGALQASLRVKASADVFIEPAVGNVWFLDFGTFDPVVAAGYEAARAAPLHRLIAR